MNKITKIIGCIFLIIILLIVPNIQATEFQIAKDKFGGESNWTTIEIAIPKLINNNNNISIEFKGGFGLKIIITNNGDSTITLCEIIFCIDAPWMILGG